MAGWLACMIVMAVAGREATRELSVFEVMELRSLIGFCLLYPLIRRAGGLRAMKAAHPWRHILRNVAHYAAQCGWLVALSLISLAQVVSIEFTMPIWVAIMAVTFLGERMGLWKNIAVLLGLVGVAVIVRPFGGEVSTGQLIALAASVGFATSLINGEAHTSTDPGDRHPVLMVMIQSVTWIWCRPVPVLVNGRPVVRWGGSW
jgi:drug/metabolite transporter (DMT)-like permease